MKLITIRNVRVPLLFAVPVAGLAIVSITLAEWRGLDRLDHPTPVKISCISCHSDKKTLASMADKAGDPLYLVHSGQLTQSELKQVSGQQSQPSAAKAK